MNLVDLQPEFISSRKTQVLKGPQTSSATGSWSNQTQILSLKKDNYPEPKIILTNNFSSTKTGVQR